MIKKMIFLIVACCLLWGNYVNSQNITLGYVDFPPYEFNTGDKPEGIMVKIVETVFKKADVPLTLQFFPFKRAYEYAKEGKSDGLFNFYKTKERLSYFDYTEPIIKNPLVFFVRRDAVVKFNRLEDLKGLKVGVMRGYTYGRGFDESRLFIKAIANTHKSHFKKLALGRIDAYPCDKLVGIHVAMENGLMSELRILSTPLKVMDGYIGFTKGKHPDVLKKVNKVIRQMHKNGEIEKSINQYIEDSL